MVTLDAVALCFERRINGLSNLSRRAFLKMTKNLRRYSQYVFFDKF
jgi:hypothetical protein